MKFTKKLFRLSAAAAIITALLVLAGYLSGTLFKKDNAEVTGASNVYNEGTVPTREDVPFETTIDESEDISETISPEERDERPKLTVGKPYSKQLVDEGSTNILIIGEDKLNNLYDTIGVVSINKDKGIMKMIMIPRDTYIEYNAEINKALEKAGKTSPGIYRINCSHHIGTLIDYEGKYTSKSISFLADVIKEKFNIETDDYIKVNLEGFIKLVDHFGGVKIKVPYAMHYDDPTQDLSIHLEKGEQLLDGHQAEGFVRFRQGYKEDGTFFEVGDIERKKNQVNFIKAFISQHGTIKNIDKIPGLFGIIGKNMKTSISVGDVLLRYIGMAKDIISNKYEIENITLDGKQIRKNGASYITIE